MKRGIVIPSVAGLLLGASAAHALKLQVTMSPRGLKGQGFKVTSTTVKPDTVAFVVERDTSKATWPRRSAYVSLPNADKGRDVPVEAKRHGKTRLYRFSVPARLVAGSVFTITEVQTANGKPDGEELIGGGTYYRFPLADFMKPRRD